MLPVPDTYTPPPHLSTAQPYPKAPTTMLGISIVLIYTIVMIILGWWAMIKTRNVGDFLLGGRSLGPWMSAFAYGTTYFSAVLFIGYAGKLGWGFGIHTMWIVAGNTMIGTILAWKLLAGRTREMTTRLNAITMPEFLCARFESKALQVVAALVVFVFLVPYSASVLMGLSYLFEMTLHLRYEYALYFLAALTAVYLVMGGYFAVAVSDFLRGIVEFIGVMVMVVLLAHHVGGFGHAARDLLPGHLAQLQAEGHVLIHAHVRVESVVLEDHRDVAVLGRDIVDLSVTDPDLTVRGLFEPGDHAQASGLTAARRANENEEFLVLDLEVHIVYGNHAGESLG